jgi:hypothetical protein
VHGDPLADRLACLVVASGAILNKGFDHIRFAAAMGVGTVTGLCKPAIIKAPLLLVHGVVRRGPACGSWPRKQQVQGEKYVAAKDEAAVLHKHGEHLYF